MEQKRSHSEESTREQIEQIDENSENIETDDDLKRLLPSWFKKFYTDTVLPEEKEAIQNINSDFKVATFLSNVDEVAELLPDRHPVSGISSSMLKKMAHPIASLASIYFYYQGYKKLQDSSYEFSVDAATQMKMLIYGNIFGLLPTVFALWAHEFLPPEVEVFCSIAGAICSPLIYNHYQPHNSRFVEKNDSSKVTIVSGTKRYNEKFRLFYNDKLKDHNCEANYFLKPTEALDYLCYKNKDQVNKLK